MEAKKTYNGFANYETWAVALWMGNDRKSYDYFRTLARAVSAYHDNSALKHLTKTERDAIALADALRCEFEECSPVRDDSTVYADLMNAALSKVDWYEIATNLLQDITEENQP